MGGVSVNSLCQQDGLFALKPRSHYKRHDPIHFNGELAISGDARDSDRWRPDGACPVMPQSSESFNFMQMKSDFRERQPIGKKTVELT